MVFESRQKRGAALAAFLVIASALPTAAQEALKLAVIDVNRIMTESRQGMEVLEALEKLKADKNAELKTKNDELVELQRRFQEGRLSLAEDKLAELQAEIEDKSRAFQRAREDAERVVQKSQAEDLKKVEDSVFPIITAVGREFGYTLIFNKFQSGLVYADDQVDITDLIIQRFDAATGD